MKNHSAKILAVTISWPTMIYFVFIIVAFVGCEDSAPTMDNIINQIKRNIVVGSSRDSTEKILLKYSVEYHWDSKQKTIIGIFRDVDRSAFVGKSIKFSIVFDENDHVVSTKWEDVLTGL